MTEVRGAGLVGVRANRLAPQAAGACRERGLMHFTGSLE